MQRTVQDYCSILMSSHLYESLNYSYFRFFIEANENQNYRGINRCFRYNTGHVGK